MEQTNIFKLLIHIFNWLNKTKIPIFRCNRAVNKK